ncbi:MAG: hypothetical protein AB9869_07895 [Verrucomicrobiia bacterium]
MSPIQVLSPPHIGDHLHVFREIADHGGLPFSAEGDVLDDAGQFGDLAELRLPRQATIFGPPDQRDEFIPNLRKGEL